MIKIGNENASVKNENLFEKLKDDNIDLSTRMSYTHPKKTKGRSIRTTIGRIIINNLLPENMDFINEAIDKSKLQDIISTLIEKYDSEDAAKIVSELQRVGFKLSSINPKSFNIDAFIPSKEWRKKKQEFKKKADSLADSEFLKEADKLTKLLIKELDDNDIGIQDVINSGSKGGAADWQALLVSRGLVVDINGKISKIVDGTNDGLSIEEFYTQAGQSRRVFYYKSTETAKPGYLARRVTMANAGIKITKKDCKTTNYLELFVTPQKAKTFIGRYYKSRNSLKLVETADEIANKKIQFRSPLYCKTKDGICETCYGILSEKLNNKNIGIIAGGAINMEAVNALMKMKHKSSQVEIIDIDFPKIIQNSNSDIVNIRKLFNISKTELYAKTDLTIVIDKKEYKEEFFTDLGDKFYLPGILDVEFGEAPKLEYLTLPFNFQVNIWKPEAINTEKKLIKMTYSAGEKVISQDRILKETNPAIVDKLVEGGMKYLNNPEVLLDAIQNELSGLDSVHLEIVVAGMFRAKKDNTIPGRLVNYKNCEIIGCKKLPFIDSWVSGLAFENINKAMKTALVDNKKSQLNPIEKIVLDRFYIDKSI